MAGEWGAAPLRDLITFTRDGEWGSDQPSADRMEMLVVRGTDFARFRFGDFAEIPRRFVESSVAFRKQLCANDVLIETAGGTKDQSTGRSVLVKQRHLVRAGIPVTCASFERFLRLDLSKVDPAFVFYWLQLMHSSGEMEVHQVQHTGVARFQFTKFAESTQVPLPPLPEQRAIAHILGTLDDKIEVNRRMSETLEAIARALFESWFVRFDPVRRNMARKGRGQPSPAASRHPLPLGEGRGEGVVESEAFDHLFPDRLVDSELGPIPEGWKVGTLADLSVLNPEVWTKETRPARINYVDLSNTKWGRIDSTTAYHSAEAPSRAQRVLRPGDTIIGTVRPGNGSYAFIAEGGLTGSTGFAVLRPRAAYYAEVVYLAATAPDNIDRLAHLADGAAYPAVRTEVVAATPVVCPTDEVLARFSQAVCPAFAKIAQNEHESRTLAALRDALLPKLISGEIRVKDAEKFIREVL